MEPTESSASASGNNPQDGDATPRHATPTAPLIANIDPGNQVQAAPIVHQGPPPYYIRILWWFQDYYDDIMNVTWQHVLFRVLSLSLFAFNMWLLSIVLSPNSWKVDRVQSDNVPFKSQNLKK